MELKEGYYLRTKQGEIHKIKSINDEYIEYENGFGVPYDLKDYYIVKASNNIIDLIEEDDLIKCLFGEQTLILQVGARYTTSHPKNGFVKGVFVPDNEFWSLEMLVEEDILQSIVTKEQFGSMSYKVEE